MRKKKKRCSGCHTCFKFVLRFSDPMMDVDTQRLYKFEPENPNVSFVHRYLKKIIRILLMLCFFLYIVLSQSTEIGKLKSQSLGISRVQNMTFVMSSKLMPIHSITTIKKHEITNRMECLVNKKHEPCIRYCIEIAKT